MPRCAAGEVGEACTEAQRLRAWLGAVAAEGCSAFDGRTCRQRHPGDMGEWCDPCTAQAGLDGEQVA